MLEKIKQMTGKKNAVESDTALTKPSQKEVVEKAVRRLAEERVDQKAIAEQSDIDDKINNPYRVVEEVQQSLISLRPRLIEFLNQESPVMKTERNALKDNDKETMAYVVEENYRDTNDNIYTIFGGMESTLYNLCNKLGYGTNDFKIVKYSHQITAENQFKLATYTTNDTVAVVPAGKIK